MEAERRDAGKDSDYHQMKPHDTNLFKFGHNVAERMKTAQTTKRPINTSHSPGNYGTFFDKMNSFNARANSNKPMLTKAP